MGFFFPSIAYTLRNEKKRLLFIGSIALIAILLVVYTDEDKWWNRLLDPTIGISTFIFAFAVWSREAYQNWEQNLPKRLTVRFIYKGKLLLICKNAILTSEGDIRQWGQQIGSQMNRNQALKFEPFFEINIGKPIVKYGEYFKPYYLIYFLSDLPSDIPNIQSLFNNQQYLHWEQLKDNNKHEDWLPHPEQLPPIHQNDSL